jgi:hypothetical protein
MVAGKSKEAGHRGQNFAYSEADKDKFRKDPTFALQYRLAMENEMVNICVRLSPEFDKADNHNP